MTISVAALSARSLRVPKPLLAAFGGLTLVLLLASPAGATSFGPSAYLRFADSPFASLSFSYFYLENFEDHLLNTPGVTANAGSAVTSVAGFSGTIIDSVRDDGLPTGPCPQVTAPNPCDSFFNTTGTVTFTFNAGVLGSLPTHVGLVWTDGTGTTVTFSASGPGGLLGSVVGNNLGDGSFLGGTAEDRFFGWSDPGGISSITITDPPGGIEIDHLQYGALSNTTVPEPGTLVLIGTGAVLALRRRRRS